MTNKDQVVYGRTPQHDATTTPRYFAPNVTPSESNGVTDDPTNRSGENSEIQFACKVPVSRSVKIKSVEAEIRWPQTGPIEVALIVNGAETGIKFNINAGATTGIDETDVLINGGSLFAYRLTGSTQPVNLTMIQENLN